MSSPFAFSNVPKEWRKVCQPIFLLISADYIHLYHGNAALLAESLEVIQRTSAVILSALETPTAEAEAAQEAEPELAKAS
jgi:hypothetical protein